LTNVVRNRFEIDRRRSGKLDWQRHSPPCVSA
jgi:hypothetical protein